MREQRQRAGFVARVVQQGVHQPRLKLPAAALGGLFDGAAQLGLAHRADKFLSPRQPLAQRIILGALRVKIRPQCQDDEADICLIAAGCHQVGDEGSAGGLVVAQRNQLLKLIYQ